MSAATRPRCFWAAGAALRIACRSSQLSSGSSRPAGSHRSIHLGLAASIPFDSAAVAASARSQRPRCRAAKELRVRGASDAHCDTATRAVPERTAESCSISASMSGARAHHELEVLRDGRARDVARSRFVRSRRARRSSRVYADEGAAEGPEASARRQRPRVSWRGRECRTRIRLSRTSSAAEPSGGHVWGTGSLGTRSFATACK